MGGDNLGRGPSRAGVGLGDGVELGDGVARRAGRRPYVSAIQPKISRQSKRQITRLITTENGSSAGQSGGAGADGGPVGVRNGGADVLDALRAEDGTEAAGGG